MSGDSLAVSVRRSADSRRVEVHLEGLGEPIWWEWSGQVKISGDSDCDDQFAIMAALPYAMAHGKNIRFQGTADDLFLRNIEQIAEVWATWFPNDYKAIKVVCDTECKSSILPQTQGSVFAFSGGVDSTYTLLQHYNGLAGRDNKKVGAAMCMHGFNFPYGEQAGFNTLIQSMDWLTTDLKIPLITVRTNWRNYCINWSKFFILGLSACFHQLSTQFSSGTFSTDFTYKEDYAERPYGNNAVTNALLSSNDMRIDHYGAATRRVDKVAYLLTMPEFASHLNVCWEGPRTGRNCGKCTKCVRLMLECVANGYDPKIVFETKLNFWSLWTKIPATKRAQQIRLLRVTLEGLKKHNRAMYYSVALRVFVLELLLPTLIVSVLTRKIRHRLVHYVERLVRFGKYWLHFGSR